MAVRNVVLDMGQVLLRFDGMLFARIFTEDEGDATLLDQALFSSPTWTLLDAGVVDDFEAAHRLHEEMGCIQKENPAMGLYFICDPDGQRIEILPER